MKFRNIKAEEIDVRVGQVGDDYCTLLLYKDARVDMNILDETVGVENWQREHYECKGNLFCRVGIDVNAMQGLATPNWVWKSDCGTESNTEKEKGEASDSFKRACVNWGIGRELYTSPFIKIYCKTKDKKVMNLTYFVVSDIVIEEKSIKGLQIKAYDKENRATNVVFSWGNCDKKPKQSKPFEVRDKPKMTLAEAKAYKFVSRGTTYTVGELEDSQLVALKETKLPELREAVNLVLEHRAKEEYGKGQDS